MRTKLAASLSAVAIVALAAPLGAAAWVVVRAPVYVAPPPMVVAPAPVYVAPPPPPPPPQSTTVLPVNTTMWVLPAGCLKVGVGGKTYFQCGPNWLVALQSDKGTYYAVVPAPK